MKFTQEIVLEKLKKYCAYQDRCHQEVRYKILAYKVYGDDLEEIISALIEENFLNEERFAKSYARGKFKIKKWGKNKIKQELLKRRISAYCIKKAMLEIDDELYIQTLKTIIQKKIDSQSNYSILIRRDKAIKYAYSRGYETNLIYKIIKEIELGD